MAKCLLCLNSGLIPYLKKENERTYEYYARCTCIAGEPYQAIMPSVEVVYGGKLKEIREYNRKMLQEGEKDEHVRQQREGFGRDNRAEQQAL